MDQSKQEIFNENLESKNKTDIEIIQKISEVFKKTTHSLQEVALLNYGYGSYFDNLGKSDIEIEQYVNQILNKANKSIREIYLINYYLNKF